MKGVPFILHLWHLLQNGGQSQRSWKTQPCRYFCHQSGVSPLTFDLRHIFYMTKKEKKKNTLSIGANKNTRMTLMVVFRNGRVCLRVMDDATLGGYLLPVPNASLHSALSPFSRLCLMHGRCGPCTLLAGEGGLLLSIVQYLNRGGGGGFSAWGCNCAGCANGKRNDFVHQVQKSRVAVLCSILVLQRNGNFPANFLATGRYEIWK